MREKITQKLLEKVKEDYNTISQEFDQTRQNEWSEFENFKNHLRENVSIADIGCGNGRLCNFIKKHLKNFHYTGVDNSKNLLEKAKINFSKETNKPLFILGDLQEIPLADESQDLVFCIAAFHHLPSRKYRIRALSELSRILKKDGILIMSNWNLFQPKYHKYVHRAFWRWLFSLGRYGRRDTFIPWGNSGIKRYYYAFRPRELRNLLYDNDFKILEENTERNIVMTCQKA